MKILLILWSLVNIIGLVRMSVSNRSACICLEDSRGRIKCTCSGADFTNTSSLYSAGLCTNGTPSTLILNELPKLAELSDGFEPPLSSGCVGWSSLTALMIHQTGLRNFSSTMFRGLHDLKLLDISNNSYITNYREEAFRSVGGTLIELIATDNRVHSLTKNVFSGLKRIQVISLSRNKIGYIAADVFSSDCCDELTVLRLDNNILTDLEDDTFVGLRSLQILDLRGNPLQRLTSLLFQPVAKTLKKLKMSHDDATTFGGFSSLPQGMFLNMSELKVLEIVELKLRNLTSQSFSGLINLEKLSLRGNRLTLIPENAFSSLRKLQVLDLSANALMCLPDNTKEQYASLRFLDLSWNGLTHLTRAGLIGIARAPSTPEYPRLVLNLSSNPIQRIEPDAFCELGGAVDLVISELDNTELIYKQSSLWNSINDWPDSPLALLGNESIIRRLILYNSHEGIESVVEQTLGRADSDKFCGEGINNLELFSDILSSKFYTQATYTLQEVNTSLNSECPWLAPLVISERQLSKLGVPGLSSSRNHAANGHLGNSGEPGSRIYLLVIVAICVTFLLTTFTIIMCYRSWSRRASQKMQMNGDVEELRDRELLSSAHYGFTEKQELLDKSQKSNGTVHMLAITKTLTKDSPMTKTLTVSQNSHEGVTETVSTIKPPPLHSENGAQVTRPNSQESTQGVENLTAFGVI